MSDIDVSVWMITYNHQSYIELALDSILAQETALKIEIVIGEDCSTDETREIIKRYESDYPNIIKPIFYSQNVGVQKNFAEVIGKCKGKYIALCEGDDYWTDPKKLQKQVDFLESNTQYSMACHSSQEVDENGKVFKIASREKSEVTLSDVLKEGWFIRTATMLFKREAIEDGFPSFFYDSYSTDYILQVMILKQGPCHYLKDPMAAYRHHSGGISNSSREVQITRWVKKMALLDELNSFTLNQYDKEISQQKHFIQEQLSFYLIRYPKLFKNFGFEFYLNNLNLEKALTQLFKRIKNRYSPSK